MGKYRSFGLGALLAIAAYSSAQTVLDPTKGLLVGTPDAVSATFAPGAHGGYRVKYSGQNAFFVIHLPSISWLGRSHMDVRLRNNGVSPAHIEMDIHSLSGQGWMTSSAVIGVGEVLNLTMPLFDGSLLGVNTLPSISDAALAQTRTVGNIYPAAIDGLYFFSKDTSAADVSVESVAGTNHSVPSTGIVDTFGQQSHISWTGKIASVQQLQGTVTRDPNGTYPYAADAYGGILGGPNYGTSSRFHVVSDSGRFYLVTPAGNRFFSMGVNEVGNQAWTQVQGREALFTDLPNLEKGFASHFSVRNGQLGFTPYSVNLERKYGANWRGPMDTIFMKRLRSWGFNTVGVNSWDSLMSQQSMPSTFGLNLWSACPTLYAYDGRSFPDVFSPAFTAAAQNDISTRVHQVAVNHAFSIGMFVDDEMPWGQGQNADPHYRYALAVASLNTPASAAHARFLSFLRARYSSISALNYCWGQKFQSWADLNTGKVPIPTTLPTPFAYDLSKFTSLFANQYFSTIRNQIRNSGYQGLYLGCRFTKVDYTPEVLSAGKLYTDVLSFNIYDAYPSHTNADLKSLNFPIMISEFCFGASDQGRVGMALYPSMTENQRIASFGNFVNDIETWPNVVGAHWYRWEDFPTTAKVDEDNMQEGLLSITDQPYAGFVAQTAKYSGLLASFLLSQASSHGPNHP